LLCKKRCLLKDGSSAILAASTSAMQGTENFSVYSARSISQACWASRKKWPGP